MLFPVELVVRSLPEIYAERTLEFVSRQVNASPHIEFYLNWSTNLLTVHAGKDDAFKQQTLISSQDAITRKYEVLSKICDFNKYTLKVLIDLADGMEGSQQAALGSDDDDEEMESEDEDNLVLIRRKDNGNTSDVAMSGTDDSSD